MTAVFAAAIAAIIRRRLQTFIIGIVVLLTAATGVLAIALLVVSHAPFDSAFAAARGAHVTATFQAGTETDALAASATAPGVTAAAGPYAEITASAVGPGGLRIPAATIVGRRDYRGSVDRLTLDSGSWLTGPGQIVLSRQYAGPLADQVGAEIHLSTPDSPMLRLVGIADSVTGSADAWVWPSQSDVLHAAGTSGAIQMLYRFSAHGSDTDLRRSLATATAALPDGSVTGTVTYLAVRAQVNRSISAFVPFVVAFAVLGIVMSVLITSNVVSGAVVAGYRTIGVQKTLGFTPRQVVAVYVLQVLIPAIGGCVAGVAAGVGLAAPLLADTDRAYDLPDTAAGVPAWVIGLVLVAAPLLVAGSATVPAVRAGRLAANEAISVGRAPHAGRGLRLRRAIAGARLPRSTALGLSMPLARPARTVGTVVAITLGAVTLIFAVGLGASLSRVQAGFSRIGSVPIVVHTFTPGVKFGPGTAPTPTPGAPQITDPIDTDSVLSTVTSEPGTAHAAITRRYRVRAAGISADVTVEAYSGDSSWTGFPIISGHWYAGADQVVASSYTLRQTGHRVGDHLTLIGDAGQRTVTIVGEFLGNGDYLDIIGDAVVVADMTTDAMPGRIEVGLTGGTKPAAYAQALQAKFPESSGVYVDDRTQGNQQRTFVILYSLITTLTLLLCGVAGLGVLNTVVLNTRERIHDIGVLKSLGMTPRQVRGMVIASMVGLGLIAGAVAVPGGVALQHWILPVMGNAADTGLPRSVIDVYSPMELVLLGLAGVVIAVAGALLPSTWAARSRVATALRAE